MRFNEKLKFTYKKNTEICNKIKTIEIKKQLKGKFNAVITAVCRSLD